MPPLLQRLVEVNEQRNEPRPEHNLHRIANERETGDPAEDHLRRLARRIVSHEKAAKAKADRARSFELARDRARAEVDAVWHAEA